MDGDGECNMSGGGRGRLAAPWMWVRSVCVPGLLCGSGGRRRRARGIVSSGGRRDVWQAKARPLSWHSFETASHPLLKYRIIIFLVCYSILEVMKAL